MEKVVARVVDKIKKESPQCIFFGERHQKAQFNTSFFTLLTESAEQLISNGYTRIFIELLADSNEDLQSYFTNAIDIATFRAKWLKPNTFVSLIPDSCFARLRTLAQQHKASVTPFNKEDPGRDIFMYSKIFPGLETENKAIIWCGMAHALQRPAEEKTDWSSCAELLSNSGATIFSMAQISRDSLLDNRFDIKLEQILDSNGERGVCFDSEWGSYSETVIKETQIGIPEVLPEFTKQKLKIRFRHFNGIFVDPTRFLTIEEESLQQGNAAYL